MKKFEKGKRFLTFLLVALMVVQQSSVTTLAEELAEYTQEAQNQDAEAVAEVSEANRRHLFPIQIGHRSSNRQQRNRRHRQSRRMQK